MAVNDPTRPLIYSAAVKNKTLRVVVKQPLTAIISRNNERLAIIEEDLYRTGDFYRGEKILAISAHQVTLASPKGRRFLTLFKNIKK